MHVGVVVDEGDDLAVVFEDALQDGGGLRRAAELEGLGGVDVCGQTVPCLLLGGVVLAYLVLVARRGVLPDGSRFLSEIRAIYSQLPREGGLNTRSAKAHRTVTDLHSWA